METDTSSCSSQHWEQSPPIGSILILTVFRSHGVHFYFTCLILGVGPTLLFIVYCGFSPKSTPKYPPGKGQDPPIKRGPRTFAPFFLRHASKKGATCLKKRSNLPQKKGATFNLTNTRILRR